MVSPIKHLAIIMDGNRRWAKQRGALQLTGYDAGVKALHRAVAAVIEAKIPILTVFAFSTENWRRPSSEVDYLLNTILKNALNSSAEHFIEYGVKVVWVGQRDRVSKNLLEQIQNLEQATKNATKLQLNIALDYGGQWEIVQACQRLLQQIKHAKLSFESESDWHQAFSHELAINAVPPPDLLIRTGGEHRLSNFMLWHLAYTELYFVDQYWPDFTADTLHQALTWYDSVKRRFGGNI